VLDAINPLSVAWELMPFSFVADWAVPISTYLQVRGLSSTLVGTFVTTNSEYKSSEGAVMHQTYPCKPWRQVTFGFEGNYTRNVSIDRTVSSTLDIPTPEFKGFGKLLTWTHAVDSLALMLQQYKMLGNTKVKPTSSSAGYNNLLHDIVY